MRNKDWNKIKKINEARAKKAISKINSENFRNDMKQYTKLAKMFKDCE